jgi:hypothetical protein
MAIRDLFFCVFLHCHGGKFVSGSCGMSAVQLIASGGDREGHTQKDEVFLVEQESSMQNDQLDLLFSEKLIISESDWKTCEVKERRCNTFQLVHM